MDAVSLWAYLVDAPEMGVAAFVAGWLSGMFSGYVIFRLVLR